MVGLDPGLIIFLVVLGVSVGVFVGYVLYIGPWFQSDTVHTAHADQDKLLHNVRIERG
jgi:phage shock protein PspC (stress-responsive transcriptional regulator)